MFGKMESSPAEAEALYIDRFGPNYELIVARGQDFKYLWQADNLMIMPAVLKSLALSVH
jgi:hypothetical protein